MTPLVCRALPPLRGPATQATRAILLLALVTIHLVLVGPTHSALANPAVVPGPVSLNTAGPLGTLSGTVPDGVCAVRAIVVGGGGALEIGLAEAAGAGADIRATIAVVPGQSYSGGVGAGGTDDSLRSAGGGPGGVGGGGASGTGTGHIGAGGGGLSQLDIAGVTVIIAGGGGGSGAGHSSTRGAGGDAGFAGIAPGTVIPGTDGGAGYQQFTTNGVPPGESGDGGQGGQVAGPGAGGTVNPPFNAAPGFPGVGSDGGNGGPDLGFDTSGGGGGGVFGGGGGSSSPSNGSGPPVADGNVGGGGGGGASFLIAASPDANGTPPANVIGAKGPEARGFRDGAAGQIQLTWIPCEYDLSIAKSVSPTTAQLGDTITTTIAITNDGPDPMSRGDIVTLTDSLPGSGTKTISSITVAGGSGPSGLDATPITCNAAAGATMPSPLVCSRPFSSSGATAVPASGMRGLDVGETITVVYTQVADAADVDTTLNNTASVTDRGDPDNNSADASVGIVGPAVELDKQLVGEPVNNGDGTFSVSYVMVVTNTGGTDLVNVVIDDDLSATFGSSLISSAVDSNTCSGATLFASSPPGTGDTCEVIVSAVVDPGANVDPFTFTNDATVDAESPNGIGASDDDSADTTFAENASIAVAKAATAAPVSNGDGTFTLTYGLIVENDGAANLAAVQVADDMSATFASATSWSVDSATVTGGTGTCTISPTPYNGSPAVDLLAGNDALAVGETCTIDVTVTVEPGATLGIYDNTATATGTSPSGAPVTDDSQDGTETDPDGDGDPTNNDVPTPVSFPENPEIGLTKDITAGPASNGDGTFTIEYTLVVTNTGDVPLEGVGVNDDLNATFGTTLESFTKDLDTCADTATLNASVPPGAGETCTQVITVIVRPGGDLGPYENLAVTSGTSPGGTEVSDQSQDGPDGDPDGDGDPNNNSEPTPAVFPENPEIGLAKDITTEPVSNGDGTFTLDYTIVATNTGDVLLSNISIDDDLAATYGAAFVSSTTVSDSCVGITLQASIPPGAGDTCTQVLSVIVEPGANLGPYENLATVDGTTPGGVTVSDNSQDGTDPDPDGDGDPSNNSTPTPATFEENPEIGLTKAITDGPLNNGDGTYELEYTLIATNTGDVPLSNVAIDDDLAATFGAALLASTTVSDSCAGITLNASVPPGAGDTCTQVISVTVEPTTNLGPWENLAVANGTSPGGETVDDDSNDSPEVDADGDGVPDDADGDGVPDSEDPDPDGDGDPTNNDVPTSVVFSEDPEITLTKALTDGPTPNGDGSWTFDYAFVVENSGDIVLYGAQITDDLTATFPGVPFTVDAVNSTDLAASASFDGSGDLAMLDGSDVLVVGQSGSIVVTITIIPGGNFGRFDNTATADGTSPSGAGVSDDSQDTPVVDADGDGVPDDSDGDGIPDHLDNDPDGDGDPTNDSDPTPFSLPGIANTKAVTDVVNNNDGTYDVTYEIVVENVGNLDLQNVQVADDLSLTFASATAWSHISNSVLTGGCTASATYDGSADTGLLAGIDNLAIGESCDLELVVNIRPGAFLGDYDNTSTATGNGPDTLGPDGTVIPGAPVSDDSNDDTPGADGSGGTDPDGDRDPSNNSNPTPVSFLEVPEITTTKAVSSGPVNNGDGTFTFDYTFTIENTGDVILHAVQLTDDLDATFGSVAYTMDALSSADFAVNAAFDGSADSNMLAATDVLPIGSRGSISMTVTITPAGNFGPFDNQTNATGVPPSGLGSDGLPIDDDGDGIPDVTVTDSSDDNPPVDADGDGIPDDSDGDGIPDHEEINDGDGDRTNDDDPTPLPIPGIGLTKSITDVQSNGDGTYVVTYELVPTNVGSIDLFQIQVTDDLTGTYAAANAWSIASVSSPDFAVNPAFDGSSDVNLLAGIDGLAVGGSGVITMVVNLEPGSVLGPWENTADTSGVGPGRVLPDGSVEPGTRVTDTSQNSPNADTDGDGIPDNLGNGDSDGDGDPTNNNVPTVLDLTENPEITLSKGLTAGPTFNANGSFDVTFELVATNTGDITLEDVAVYDDLIATFAGDPFTAAVSDATGPGAPSETFDGSADTNLLAPGVTLVVGESTTITVSVNFVPSASPFSLENTATATGISPSGRGVDDVSQDHTGADPDGDPDGDGNPSNNGDPTPFGNEIPTPMIGLSKQLIDGPTDNSDGTFALGFELIVTNTGVIDLANVNITDDLASQWPGITLRVTSVTSADLTVNSGFDGVDDVSILTGTDGLAVGESGTVLLSVDVTRPAEGELENQAETSATDVLGINQVNDLSQDGAEGDPNGDGIADEQAPTPARFPDLPNRLAFTGAVGVYPMVSTAIVLALGGSFAIILGRRRREEDEAAI